MVKGADAMRVLILFVVMFLVGCSNLSSEEESMIGGWEWSLESSQSVEKGYLILEKDRSYKYEIESKIRVESLSETSNGENSVWRLVGPKLCFHPIGNEEAIRCPFSNVSVTGNRLSFILDGFFDKHVIDSSRSTEMTGL